MKIRYRYIRVAGDSEFDVVDYPAKYTDYYYHRYMSQYIQNFEPEQCPYLTSPAPYCQLMDSGCQNIWSNHLVTMTDSRLQVKMELMSQITVCVKCFNRWRTTMTGDFTMSIECGSASEIFYNYMSSSYRDITRVMRVNAY